MVVLRLGTASAESYCRVMGGAAIDEKKPGLSLIVPMYNEERRIESTLLRLLAWLEKQPFSWELLLVDDGSHDSTASIVERFAGADQRVFLIKNPHSGKAYAIRTGVFRARSQYTLHADADLSTPPTEFSKLIAALQEGYDLAIGSRSARTNAPWYRQLMSKLFPIFIRIMAVHGLHDTQCGFKAYRTEVARDLFTHARLYSTPAESLQRANVTAGSDVEILFLAQKLGYRIKEVSVEWVYAGGTKVSPVRDSLRGLLDVFRMRWYDLNGIYGK